MSIEVSGREGARRAAHGNARGSDVDMLRRVSIAVGIGWSVIFVVVGPWFDLQTYGDGSIFSYAVAVQDVWAFHWHNIVGRSFVYLVSLLPAETYVALTRDARGGIVLYGVLFFAAPLCGLAATFAADRSPGRVVFGFACLSTACLCPFVFGFPTEMWMAHAVFWPTLALAHGRGGTRGTIAVFLALLALMFTYEEGGIGLALAILATIALRGTWSARLGRAAGAFVAAVAIWTAVRVACPPDDYFGPVLARAAWHVFDAMVFTADVMLLVYGALASYGVAVLIARRFDQAKAHLYAVAAVALALAIYWLRFDHALHAEDRYYLRTLLLVVTPVLGLLAAACAVAAEGELRSFPRLSPCVSALTGGAAARATAGAVVLVTLVHAVETAKFVTAWTHYRAAVRALATGTASDPALGNPRFVSSARIDARLNRLAWFSTTPYLSVLVAPNFAPARLVIDPTGNYFWLSCETATNNLAAARAVPADSRRLVRIYSCLHR